MRDPHKHDSVALPARRSGAAHFALPRALSDRGYRSARADVQPYAPSGWNTPEVKQADVCLLAAPERIISNCQFPIANCQFENRKSEIGNRQCLNSCGVIRSL